MTIPIAARARPRVDARGIRLVHTVFFGREGKRNKRVTIGFAGEAAER